MYKVLVILLISFVATLKTAPIGDRYCLDQGVQGLKIKDTQFVAPVLVEGQKELIFFPSEGDKVGFVEAANLKGRFMDLDHFRDNYKVPDNIDLVYVKGARPPFGIE